MSFLGLNSAGNALEAFQTALNVTADNISNENTPGASRQVANIVEATPIASSPGFPTNFNGGTLGQGSQVAQIQRIHQNSFDALFRGATSSQNFFTVEQQQLTTLQSNFGEPNNGVNTALSGLQTAISSLAATPQGQGVAQGVLSAAQTFVSALNNASGAITQQQQSVLQAATTTVSQANTLIDSIASLNGSIAAATAVGNNPNTFLDQRDEDIDQLSQLVSVTTSLQPDGSAYVSINGQALVNDTTSYNLASPVVGTAANGTPALVVGFANDPNPLNPTPVPLGSGQLAGYADLYNNKLAGYANQLNAVASTTAAEVDRVTQASVDQNGNPGGALFTSLVPGQAITATNIQVGFTSPSEVTTGLVSTAAGKLVQPLNAANNTVNTAAPILNNATLNNPPALALNGTLLVGVDGIVPVAPAAGPPPVAGVQAFQYSTAPGGNADTINDFVTNFNAAQLGVTASFDATSQTVVFTRDPNSSLAQRAQQGANATTAGFTITDSAGAGVTTQNPQGANATFLLQALGAAGINGVNQNAGNASAIGDNAGANALLGVFSQTVGIGALQTTSATAVVAPGSVTISPPAAAPGAFATVQVGQQLTVDAGTAAQENVTVAAVNRATGTITATFANAHLAGFSIATTPTRTIGAAYGALVTQQGTDLQTATTGTSTQTSLASSIDSARQSVDGINVDEETQNLIKYQSAYEAAAKTVDTINQVLQDIITLGNDTVSVA